MGLWQAMKMHNAQGTFIKQAARLPGAGGGRGAGRVGRARHHRAGRGGPAGRRMRARAHAGSRHLPAAHRLPGNPDARCDLPAFAWSLQTPYARTTACLPAGTVPRTLPAAHGQRLEAEYKAVTDSEKAAVVALGGLHVVGTERHVRSACLLRPACCSWHVLLKCMHVLRCDTRRSRGG
jgi:hypothetical protein